MHLIPLVPRCMDRRLDKKVDNEIVTQWDQRQCNTRLLNLSGFNFPSLVFLSVCTDCINAYVARDND